MFFDTNCLMGYNFGGEYNFVENKQFKIKKILACQNVLQFFVSKEMGYPLCFHFYYKNYYCIYLLLFY